MMTTKLVTEVPLPAERRLLSKPFMVMFVSWAGMHGAAKVDWVAEWLPWVKLKKTVSPRAALTTCWRIVSKKHFKAIRNN
jgi:hypothetical protein